MCLWLTGLPCSGKTTTAARLVQRLEEMRRVVVWLDGDKDSEMLSGGLGFSPEDRDLTGRRTAWVASQVVKVGGLAVCSLISPYRHTRARARAMFAPGRFMEIFLDTPLEECQRRDVKGLYARAHQGQIKDFTGVDAPYEEPLTPELSLDGKANGVDANVEKILRLVF